MSLPKYKKAMLATNDVWGKSPLSMNIIDFREVFDSLPEEMKELSGLQAVAPPPTPADLVGKPTG